MNKSVNNINHPEYYNSRQRECIDEMVAIFGVNDTIAFCKLNAWKYRYRAGNKGDYDEDMKKADWYINKMIELQKSIFDNREVW